MQDEGGHRHSKVAAAVAKSFLVQQDIGVPALADTAQRLSEGACAALVEHYFFANARQHLITEEKIADHERLASGSARQSKPFSLLLRESPISLFRA